MTKPRRSPPADLTIHPAPPELWKPYRFGTRDESFSASLIGPTQLFTVMWWDSGRLADFLILQQVEGDGGEGEWDDIIRIDCCHNEVHMHRLYADPDAVYKVIRPICTSEDLMKGYDMAVDMMNDEWGEHMRKWQGGR